jgi:membrane dipeptidase
MPYLDLHAHLAMQFPIPALSTGNAARDKLYARIFRLAKAVANGRSRVTLDYAASARLKAFCNVLYDPSDEFCPATQPFASIRKQMELVNRAVEDDGRFRLATCGSELAQIVADGKRIAVFHGVEGGYAVEDPGNVSKLADSGVAYVILAHLFYRGIATCVNPFPCLDDSTYPVLYPQPQGGLTTLGKEICHSLFENRVLVDITHSTQESIDDVFEIASKYPGHPVIASHTAARSVNHALINMSASTIQRIAESGGIVGVIFYGHWLKPSDPAVHPGQKQLDWLFHHVNAIAEASSCDSVGLGSDFDGFIKPIAGLENTKTSTILEAALQAHYGQSKAAKILHENALRVLKAGWRP